MTTIVGSCEMVLHKEGDGDYHSGEVGDAVTQRGRW